ncbi:MAG: HNH endonuclease signature motif containing protein [Ramlibacter sp.]
MVTRLFVTTVVATALALAAAAEAFGALPAPGAPGAPDDPRYCGEPERDGRGRIKRSRLALREFAQQFPCPATLERTPSCPGWAIDHVIPMASGGCDRSLNMQWLPLGIKSCAGSLCKDRWERIYHGAPRAPVDLKGTP